MPVDSMHSVIERASNKMDMQSMNEWITVIKMVRQHPFPYEVKVLEHTDFKNWNDHQIFPKGLKKYDSGTPIVIRNFTSLKIKKSNVLKFKMNNSTDTTERITLTNIPPECPKPKNLYSRRLPISSAKYNDLKKLCDKNIIRKHLAHEFLNLPHKGNVIDILQETDEEDEVEEEELF